MAKITKRQKAINEMLEAIERPCSIEKAIDTLKAIPATKFIQSVDASINLGVDPRKSDQVVRGACSLPHGTGKSVKVAVFAQGENAEKAKAAGADIVGFEDLAEDIKKGQMDFDVVIATPDSMRVVGQLGQILGPRGLMPNPKVGTVSADVESAVKNVKAGQARFRTDKAGIIHCRIGSLDFDTVQVKENIQSLIQTLNKLKPSSSKGVYIKKVTLSTTMGPGLQIDQASIA